MLLQLILVFTFMDFWPFVNLLLSWSIVEFCVCVLFQRLPAVLSRIGIIMASPLVRQVAHSIRRRAVKCWQPKPNEKALQNASHLACFEDLTSENIYRCTSNCYCGGTNVYVHVASGRCMLPPRQSQDRP